MSFFLTDEEYDEIGDEEKGKSRKCGKTDKKVAGESGETYPWTHTELPFLSPPSMVTSGIRE